MKKQTSFIAIRFWLILSGLLILIGIITVRMVYLTIFDRSFLQHQGNMRTLRTINIPAYRGMITDRNGVPLAISTPVNSVWVNPKDFSASPKNTQQLSHLLNIPLSHIKHIIRQNKHREFVYLKRGVNPQVAQAVAELALSGVYLEREYKRYYPQSEVASQVVGFTNIDDQGQEGLELAYNSWLTGTSGKEQVLKDLYGHVVAVLNDTQSAKPGHDLILSLDNRIQYVAYRYLKNAVIKYHAKSGSVVVLNPKTGEILAMANMPSFNPNQRPSHDYGQFRNRAVTDMFEPGSTMKAFSIASALDSGKYTDKTIIDTNPGRLKIGKNLIHDDEWVNHGKITVDQVLQKSSNIGVAKMTMSLPPEHFLDLLRRVGFGERTSSNFPGESPGALAYHDTWQPFVLATLAFGYGISVTPLQLAQAYGIIANNGLQCPITFLKRDTPPQCTRAMDAKVANSMLKMLELVVQTAGTGFRAKINGYYVAGKTGTANIAKAHGYSKHHHIASFVGIAPASNPQLVVAVVVRDPRNTQDKYYGGTIAAPAFAKIMGRSLRILNIAPDAISLGTARRAPTT
jgi:cell division protein FtsI (penicillin-binding protein 3)